MIVRCGVRFARRGTVENLSSLLQSGVQSQLYRPSAVHHGTLDRQQLGSFVETRRNTSSFSLHAALIIALGALVPAGTAFCQESQKTATSPRDDDQETEEEALRAEIVRAIRVTDTERALRLIKQNGKIDDPVDRLGNSALSVACAGGRLVVISALLKQGANPETVNVFGESCFSRAADEGQLEVVQRLAPLKKQALLGANADPTIGDVNGDSVLHLCAREGELVGIWLLLVEMEQEEAAVAVEVQNKAGTSIVQEADEWGMDAGITVRLSVYLPRFIKRYVLSFIFWEAISVWNAPLPWRF